VVEIPDGDVMAGLAALVPGGGIDLSAGIGGAPEGVITACAVRLMGGDMQGKPAPQSDEERQLVTDAGEVGRVYALDDLSESDDGIFVASGVTGSTALPGVTVSADGFHVHSVLITRDQGLLRIACTVRD
jgi:fructose-1,6-bisphosphatase II